MFFYKHCLFCFSPLPEIPSGVGEHVYPKSVYGFWRIYDVCENCMKHFGDNVDQLALQNPQILKAIEQLDLANADRYYEQIKYEATDTIDGIKVKIVLKDGNFKAKAQEVSEDFFECAEKDWENIGVRWLKTKTDLPDEEFQNEIEKLKEEYSKLVPGETTTSDKLGFSVRKKSVKDVKVDEDNLQSITPLIAKIVVSYEIGYGVIYSVRLWQSFPDECILIPGGKVFYKCFLEFIVPNIRIDGSIKPPGISHKHHRQINDSFFVTTFLSFS